MNGRNYWRLFNNLLSLWMSPSLDLWFTVFNPTPMSGLTNSTLWLPTHFDKKKKRRTWLPWVKLTEASWFLIICSWNINFKECEAELMLRNCIIPVFFPSHPFSRTPTGGRTHPRTVTRSCWITLTSVGVTPLHVTSDVLGCDPKELWRLKQKWSVLFFKNKKNLIFVTNESISQPFPAIRVISSFRGLQFES